MRFVCVTAGSPYYNPHFQRPALFPPSDGYLPPEDPLRGVARQIDAAARLKAEFPDLVIVGLRLQLPPGMAARTWRSGWSATEGPTSSASDRMVLSYPELPADVLAGTPLQRKAICRTFSDCTTAPRNGMVSGCYPLDPFYASRPEAARVKQVKEALRV